MRAIILLSGAKGAGKSTVSSMIKAMYPDAAELALADKLKEVCAQVFQISKEKFFQPDLKEVPLENPVTLNIFQIKAILEAYSLEGTAANMKAYAGKVFTNPRQILQYVGSELLRSKEPSIHCLLLTKSIGTNGVYIISDIRFMNELQFFKSNYGKDCHSFFVHRSIAELASSLDGHVSERGIGDLAKNCRIINNNCELEELEDRVEGVFEDLLERVLGLK